MTDIRTISTRAEYRQLIDLLLDPDRDLPVVAVSTRSGHDQPDIDVHQVHAATGHTAHVRILITNRNTYDLGAVVGDQATVYGGASRVYPTGHDWINNPQLSPLRFSYNPERAAQALIDDVHHLTGTPSPAARTPRLTHNPLAGLHDILTAADITLHDPASPAAAQPEQQPPSSSSSGPPTTRQHNDTTHTGQPHRPAPAPPRTHTATNRNSEASKRHDEQPDHREQQAAGYSETPPASRGALKNALARIDLLATQLAAAEKEKARAVAEAVKVSRQEASDIAVELARATDRIRALSARPATTPKPRHKTVAAEAWRPDLWPTLDAAARDAIYSTWVERVPAQDKADHALPDNYVMGPDFAASLAALDKPLRAKSLKCVVDVLTGIARDSASREVHVLRSGDGGADAAVTRDDGATCFRASVEKMVPSARRLHFWKCSDGRIELSRVVLHDDMNP